MSYFTPAMFLAKAAPLGALTKRKETTPQNRVTPPGQSRGGDKAVDPALRTLVLPDAEGREFREELQVAVRQVIMNPLRHCPPVNALSVSVGKPGNDYCGHRAHAAASVPPIPDVAGIISLIPTGSKFSRLSPDSPVMPSSSP